MVIATYLHGGEKKVELILLKQVKKETVSAKVTKLTKGQLPITSNHDNDFK